MNTTLMNLIQLKSAAMAILFWNEVYPELLPARTAKMLRSGIKNMDAGKLREGIRLAELHDSKFQARIAEDAEIERLISEEAIIEGKRLEAITLHNFLDDPEHTRLVHSAKQDRFAAFLAEIEVALNGSLTEIEAWIKRAEDFKSGMVAKMRRLPYQTVRAA